MTTLRFGGTFDRERGCRVTIAKMPQAALPVASISKFG